MEIITVVPEYIIVAMNIVIYIFLLIIGILLSFDLCIVLISLIKEIIGILTRYV